MALFKKSEPVEEPQPPASGSASGKKAVPTPTRREAEAARRARLNPQLSPKDARKRERDEREKARIKGLEAQEAVPSRALLRDFVDSRFNYAEVGLPVLFALLLLTMLPLFQQYVNWFVYLTWGYMAFMAVDAWRMWRRYKALLAERYPGTPLKGLFMYGFNRQFTFRRWRRPAPRVKRGEAI
ncbi:MAG: DUF3043 domain-containing protein [Nigerium sp.]|nr:DUF3043 domain-containing protein [Nigerium sp.]